VNAWAFLKAVGVLAVAIAVVFALLLALPLPRDFFREWGSVTGPVAWILCSLVAGRVLGLSAGRVLGATMLSGVAAAVVGVTLDHSAGLVGGLAVFGVVVAAAARRSPVGVAP
jgi:hypothetical protein